MAFVSCNDLVSVDPPEVIETMDMSYSGDVKASELEDIDDSSINWITQEQLDANAGDIASDLSEECFEDLSRLLSEMVGTANPSRAMGFYGNIQATISDEIIKYDDSELWYDIDKVNLKLSGAVSSIDAFSNFFNFEDELNIGESVSASFTDSIGVELTTDFTAYDSSDGIRDLQFNSMLKLNVTGEDFTQTVTRLEDSYGYLYNSNAYEGKLSLYVDGEISLGATLNNYVLDNSIVSVDGKIIMSVSFDELDVELDMDKLYSYYIEGKIEEIEKMIFGEGDTDSIEINIAVYDNDNDKIASGSYFYCIKEIMDVIPNFK